MPPPLRENTIKRLHINLLVLILAPLVLGGCIMPLGVQVASLIADGVSLVTTDKTLTDHGLSAVTEQDCAMWRVANGEEVCRDYEPSDAPVMSAEAKQNGIKAAEGMPWRPVEASYPLIDAEGMAGSISSKPATVESEVQVASLEPLAAPTKPPILSAVVEDPMVPASPAKTTQVLEPAPTPARETAAVKTQGGMFFVIASFSRVNGAKRFARRHAALATQVLAGTARGQAVYRVAIGPVGKAQRPGVKAKLVDAGFADTWALTQNEPKVVVEVAALN